MKSGLASSGVLSMMIFSVDEGDLIQSRLTELGDIKDRNIDQALKAFSNRDRRP
jgi:hypothetical protein